jgi:hypothetical protein
MNINELNELIVKLDKELPKKILDGKEVFDFKDSNIVLGVACIVVYKDKMLIMKRSNKVAVFQNKWAVISGHLDCVKPIKEIILEEIAFKLPIIRNFLSYSIN